MIFIISVLLAIFFVTLVIFLFRHLFVKKDKVDGRHVIITGGSSGIGRSLAILCAKNGANVTIIAQNKTKLQEAVDEIKEYCVSKSQKISFYSLNLSENYEAVLSTFQEAENKSGIIYMLVNCAGTAVASKFDSTTASDFQRMMNMNYFTAVNATRAVLPSMMKTLDGKIILVSSQAGQLGLFGYSAYSASKFALRGLAECLQMEVKPYNISITLAFPADTDTPGFSEEEKNKPLETKLISDTAGLWSPDQVAEVMLNDALSNRFLSSMGLDGWVVSCLTSGFSPFYTTFETILQLLTLGLFRLVALYHLRGFNSIVQVCRDRELDPTAEKAKLN